MDDPIIFFCVSSIFMLGVFVLIVLYLCRDKQSETTTTNPPITKEERESCAISYLADKYNLEIIKRANSILSHFGLNDDIESLSIIYISSFYLLSNSERDGKLATTMNESFFDSLKQVYNIPLKVGLDKFDDALDVLEEWELAANLYLDSQYNTSLDKLYCEERAPFYLCLVVLALALKVPKNFDAGSELVSLYKYVMSIGW